MTPDLPLRVRRAARLLVLDADLRLLLMHDSDTGLAGRPSWWITPGGGIDGEETPLEAAVRELREETGLAIEAAELRGPVWHRSTVHHTFSDHRSRQEEFFYLLRTPHFTPTSAGYTEEERDSMLGPRWWTAAELAATTDAIWPGELPRLLPALLEVAGPLAPDAPWPLPVLELPELTENPSRA